MFAVSIHLEGMPALAVTMGIIGLIGSMIIVPLAFFMRRVIRRQQLRSSIVTAQYEPPAGLSPAEMGYLFDGSFGEAETVGTIIDLLQRGVLKQHPNDKKHIFVSTKIPDKLTVLEKCLVKLIESKKEGASIKSLTYGFLKTDWHTGGESWGVPAGKKYYYNEIIHNDLKQRGFVKGHSAWHFITQSVRMDIYLLFILVVLPLLTWNSINFVRNGGIEFKELFNIMGLLAMVPVLLIPFFLPAMVLAYIRAKIVGRTWIRTPKLKKIWPQIEGFREYIRLTEQDRLSFETTLLKDKARNRALPYSIALGLSNNWEEYFFDESKTSKK